MGRAAALGELDQGVQVEAASVKVVYEKLSAPPSNNRQAACSMAITSFGAASASPGMTRRQALASDSALM